MLRRFLFYCFVVTAVPSVGHTAPAVEVDSASRILPSHPSQMPFFAPTPPPLPVPPSPHQSPKGTPTATASDEYVSPAPPLPQTESPHQAEVPNSKRESRGELIFAPNISYLRIDGTDKSSGAGAHIVSDLNFGADLTGTYHLNEKFSVFAHLNVNELNFNQPQEIAIGNSGQWDFGANAGLKWRPRSNFSASIWGGAFQELFFHSTDLTTLSLDPVWAPQVGLDLRFEELAANGIVGAGIEAQGSWSFSVTSSGYTTSSSPIYGGRVFVEKPHDSLRFELGLSYRRTELGSSAVDQTRSDAAVDLSIKWEIGK